MEQGHDTLTQYRQFYVIRTKWPPGTFVFHNHLLRPVHTRDPINPRSLPLWKNGRISNERALIGESVCRSKIQRGLVGIALRGGGERDQFFNRLKNGRGWSRSIQVVCWAGVQRGGRRYSVGWSYFDRVWSAIQRKLVGAERIKTTCFDWRTGIPLNTK